MTELHATAGTYDAAVEKASNDLTVVITEGARSIEVAVDRFVSTIDDARTRMTTMPMNDLSVHGPVDAPAAV